MKSYHLTFLSKNKNSLQSAFFFFLKTSILNFNVVKKYFQKKTKKHFLTILKSPHVNKKAQEQFEIRIFSKQLSIYSPKKLKYILFLKKTQENLFSDVKVKIKFSLNEKKQNNFRFTILNPNNYKLDINKNRISQKDSLSSIKAKKNLQKFTSKDNKKTKHFLEIVDIYGEFKLITFR
jgi:ribosomal protein S10